MTKQRGFTLIEVLVAAGVLGITASALFGLLSHSLFNLRKVQELHRYELVAEDVMNRVLLSSTLAPASAQGAADNFGAQWNVSVSPWAPPALDGKPDQAVFRIDVAVSWSGRSTRQNIRVESLKVARVAYSNYDLQSTIEAAYPR
jgi:prepilin-type N-terminal cleavage/methylation domain-containing protein